MLGKQGQWRLQSGGTADSPVGHAQHLRGYLFASAKHLCSAIVQVDQNQQAAKAMPDFAVHLTATQECKGCLALRQLALHTHQACQAWKHGRWAIRCLAAQPTSCFRGKAAGQLTLLHPGSANR